MQVFPGVVFLDEDEQGEGLRVIFRVDHDLAVLTAHGEELGSWTPMGASVEQLGVERFRLTFGAEQVIFHPDDPVDFKYEALSILNGQPPATGWMGMLAKRRDKAEPGVRDRIRTLPEVVETPEEEQPEPVVEPESEVEEAEAEPAPAPRIGLFRRKEEHTEHSFESSRIPGGLVRLVCVECGHVSIDLTETPPSPPADPEDSERAIS